MSRALVAFLTFGEKRSRPMEAGRPQANQSPAVFIVDDDPAVLNSLKFSLEIEGFSVRSYPTGANLLAAGEWPGCGCLVIDYNLPEMDGLELLSQLRIRGVAAPAILITSDPGLLLRRRAAAVGMPIVEKPLLGNALTEAIRKALNKEPLRIGK